MTVFERICIVGSGNWGSAIATVIGRNVKAHPDLFHSTVNMWTREESVDGKYIDEWINQNHINPRYLPGISLPDNVFAVRDLVKAVKDCTILVFVLPHQFVRATCNTLKGHLAPNVKGLSLIKGMDLSESGLTLVSSVISSMLDNMPVSVLMGANIANEVAKEQFCESTIGSRHPEQAEIFKKMLHTKRFNVNIIDDVLGVELCGAMKNIVAVAAGIVDGLGLGDNTKAAVIRIGLMEMKKFNEMFYLLKDTENASAGTSLAPHEPRWGTYFESCGMADLITTCFGGRNRKLAEAHARTGKSFEQLEEELLDGQKLQGPLTAKEVHMMLKSLNKTQEFPLFTAVYNVCYQSLPVSQLIDALAANDNQNRSASGQRVGISTL